MYGDDVFTFLGVRRAVRTASDWNRGDWPKLWLYNLHYFDDLNAADSGSRRGAHRALIDRWISENPPGQGNGWEPYCLSRRIVAWIEAFDADLRPEPAWLHSLAVQVRYLCGRIEWHLLGNHLFENARALVYAGAYFTGPEADRWLRIGRRILLAQMREQVLRDGAHFELSPMYHAIVLEGVLDVLNVAASRPGTLPDGERQALADDATSMLRWLAAMTHPDGEIALFGDSAFGVAPTPPVIADYAARLGVGAPPPGAPTLRARAASALHMAASGYVRIEAGEAVALLDVGEIGPDYLPAHGHADVLAFELSIAGARVVADTGTGTYAPGAERLRQRGTAAHSTVEVDGADSSELWSSFRVARRAHPIGPTLALEGEGIRVDAAHDGYRRLPGRPVHRRSWRIDSNRLSIEDRIEGRIASAYSRLHLHPAIGVEPLDDRRVSLRLPGGRRVTVTARHPLRCEHAPWHPRFGTSEPRPVLVQACADGSAAVAIDWSEGAAAPAGR